MTRLFARHTGRHCRHGSLTGWASFSQFCPPAAFDGFSRPRCAPLAVFPMAALDHPYDPSKGSAA